MRAYVGRVAAAIHRDRNGADRHRVLVHGHRALQPRRSRSTFVPANLAR
ncbi:MAG: hypothetical protein ABWY26_00845 [Microbacterium sp.]